MTTRFGVSLLLALAGCGPQGKAFDYPLDSELRLNHLQVKGSHNSYHVETPGNTVPDWHYTHAPLATQLDTQSVRALELDLAWQGGDEQRFEVYHVVLADEMSTCRLFTDCLRGIKEWSDRFPGHQPIFVQMEAKMNFRAAEADLYFSTLEREITSVWPRERIMTPDDAKGGWPTLGALRGKIFFAFDETGEVRRLYTHGDHDLDGRLLFVDSRPGDPFAAVAIINDPITSAAEIAAAVRAGLWVRTRADENPGTAASGDTSRREAAIASGAHVVTTDFPAPMNGLPYVVDIPGGMPSRCNPLIAPPSCNALAIENPAFVGSAAP